jgi:hypothetical protein
MSSFKEPSLAERQNAAIKAKKAALENFRQNAAGLTKKKTAKKKAKKKQIAKTKKRPT